MQFEKWLNDVPIEMKKMQFGIKLLTKITKLLLTMVSERRASNQAQEETKNYSINDLNPLPLEVPNLK